MIRLPGNVVCYVDPRSSRSNVSTADTFPESRPMLTDEYQARKGRAKGVVRTAISGSRVETASLYGMYGSGYYDDHGSPKCGA